VLAAAVCAAAETGSYEDRPCPRCLEGLTYDGRAGEWVACERCEGTGRAPVFVYPKAKIATCSGCRKRYRHRELVQVTEDHESLTWFPGDLLCRGCAGDAGVL
jgi:hypothetical protein